MYCFLCFSFDGKLPIFQGDANNEILKRITVVLPDLTIPESQESVFVCASCLEQVEYFYTIKTASLQNYCHLKYFDAMLKGTNNFKCNELKVVINSDELSIHPKQHISNNSTRKHKSVDEFTKKDSNLTCTNSRHQDKPKTQRGSQEKRFKCTDCHKTFKQRSRLQRHIRAHTGDKPYKCTMCPKTFTQRSDLEIHSRAHTGDKPYKCLTCQKTFTRFHNLNQHKVTHTGEKPHECDVCRKTFARESNLNAHMLTHTGEKPHKCHLCEYKCARAGDLKTHIRCHTGEKPYSCKHCEKSFTSTCNLKKHEFRHHSNEEDSGEEEKMQN